MIITLIALMGATVLLAKFWKTILDFLNGPVRNRLEKCFGQEKCQWYVNFLEWCDNKVTCAKRIVKMQWEKFKDTIWRIKSVYRKNPDGSYTKQNETILRTGAETARRIVTEETVGWEYLPNEVREEMLRRRTNEAELDERELVAEKVRQRAEEECIDLTA
jgi:hypothetical protein